MRHTILLFVICLGIVLCAVGYADSYSRTAVGDKAPALAVAEADSMVSLAGLKGKYVLLNFWNSTDAPSRRAANIYTAWKRAHPDTDLKVLSVNFDESDNLFTEIVRRDGLIADDQFHVRGDFARAIFNNYGLNRGYGALLVDPEGLIVAHNPTEADLDVMFGYTGSTS